MRFRALLVTALAVTSCVLIAAPAAVADAGSGGVSPFPAQDAALGLSTSQASSLQASVNNYLAQLGGTQVAVNEVDFAGGQLLVTIPGESFARDLATDPQPLATTHECYSGDFCVTSLPGGYGDFISKYVCSTFHMPWVSAGSWINNQTGGVRAVFYNSAGQAIYTTTPPVSYDTYYPWSDVWTILPCPV